MVVKRGGIYFADLGKNDRTSIQYGVRPVLNLQSDKGNKFSPTTLIIPLSTKKKSLPMHVRIEKKNCYNGILNQTSYALCEQIRVVPIKVIETKICQVSDIVLDDVFNCLMIATGYLDKINIQKVSEAI